MVRRVGFEALTAILLIWCLVFLVSTAASADEPSEALKAKDQTISLFQWALLGVSGAFSVVAGLLFRELVRAWTIIREEVRSSGDAKLKLIEAIDRLPQKCPFYERVSIPVDDPK